MIDNKKVFTTSKHVEEQDIQRSPQGIDPFGPHYRLRPNDLKEYKNKHIVTVDMLINRKFKNLKKK
jgi:hypothetical protein